MTAASLRRDPGNVLVALADLARATPSATLVSLEAGGVVAALGIWIWMPQAWPFILPLIALACFSVWGVIDNFVRARGPWLSTPTRSALRILQNAFTIAGCAASAAAGYVIVGIAIGEFVL